MKVKMPAIEPKIKLNQVDLNKLLVKYQEVENPCDRMELIWGDMKLDTYEAGKSIIIFLHDQYTDVSLNHAMQASLALVTEGYIGWEKYIDADNPDYVSSLFDSYLDGRI